MARANSGDASLVTNAEVEMIAPLILLAICVRLVGRPRVSHLSLHAATYRPHGENQTRLVDVQGGDRRESLQREG